MDHVARFRALVSAPADAMPLDEPALLIAAHARGDVDVAQCLAQLDDLAAACTDATFDGLRAHLFERERFRGNAQHYDDPDNSFLDRVLEERVGIPITLSVVMI